MDRQGYLTFCLFFLSLAVTSAQQVSDRGIPDPPNFQASSLSIPHYGPGRQASTEIKGPQSDDCIIQTRDFKEHLGEYFGTSPWHVVSAERYSGSEMVTIWGATLTHAYRFLANGESFEALDKFKINHFPSSITWNLFSTDDGRVVVPDASGFYVRGSGMRSKNPSWLILKDGNTEPRSSKIELSDIIEFEPEKLRKLASPPLGSRLARLLTAGGSVPTYSGEIATTISYLKDDTRFTYLLIVNIDTKALVSAEFIGEGLKSNEIAAEPYGNDGTAFYVPLNDKIIKMVYDGSSKKIEKHWEVNLPIRGRTGSTPTLMNTSNGKEFVIVIDSKCTVASVSNGLIYCSEEDNPSQLIAVERSAMKGKEPRIITKLLPDWLQTVENSPACYGDQIVVANYSGYLPNGLLIPPGGEISETNTPKWVVSNDAVEDFATGIVCLKYNEEIQNFDIKWKDAKTQVSGIPTISKTSNMVYGVGAEQSNGGYFLYGFQLNESSEHSAGEKRIRLRIGKAPIRDVKKDLRGNTIIDRNAYKLRRGEIFDAGNQIAMLKDGSLIISGGSALVRVKQRD